MINNTGLTNTAVGAGALNLNTTGNLNTATGTSALSRATADRNTANGALALQFNTTGTFNIAMGAEAMRNNTTGSANTAVGTLALDANSSGTGNTAIGEGALGGNTTASNNTATGRRALWLTTSGQSNTAIGAAALIDNITGSNNTAVGQDALANNTTGLQNTGLGLGALKNNTTGNFNVAIGQSAGSLATVGDSNIYVSHVGINGEGNTIRLGTSGQHNQTFVAGINGVTTGGAAVPVMIDGSGQLGTISSSRRFKADIQDMDAASLGLLQLRPVTFRYKKEYANGTKPLQYGLIAEEVAEVYPGLVVYGEDGQVQTVQYQKLTSMLLNELQKEHQINQAQAIQLRAQQELHRAMVRQVTDLTTQLTQQNEALKARLQQLEADASAVSVSLH
jgi:hypothetical protein